MDIGIIFLYCFFACLQMYILMATGALSFYRKIFTMKSIKIVSEMLFVMLLPLYGIIEISRIGTIANLNIFWILITNLVISIGFAYLLGRICHYIFKLDERISQSFNLMCAIPAIGALPLVIGKSFCYPDGPLEKDPYCDNLLGLMMMCYLILCIMVFAIGYILVMIDKNFNSEITEKMEYLWHILVEKLFAKNMTILYLYKKFLKSSKLANAKFEEFEENFSLKVSGNRIKYSLHKKKKIQGGIQSPSDNPQQHREVPVIIQDIQLDLPPPVENNQPEATSKQEPDDDKVCNGPDPNDPNDIRQVANTEMEIPKDYFETSVVIQDTLKDTTKATKFSKFISKSQHQVSVTFGIDKKLNLDEVDMGQFVIMYRRKDSFYPSDDNVKDVEFPVKKKNYSHLEKEKEKCAVTTANKIQIDIQNPQPPGGDEKKQKSNLIPVEQVMLNDLSNEDNIHIMKYYQQAFDWIENDPDFNIALRDDYFAEKKTIMDNISKFPPKFPIVRSAIINKKAIRLIDEEWEVFYKNVKGKCPKFELNFELTAVDIRLLLNKLYSPPIIGCILGLILSISGMREIIFSTNHYISNIVDGLYVLDKVMIPFLFLLIGLSVVSTQGLGMNVPLTKIHIGIVFILRFIIVPAFGFLNIYVWSRYYGGIVKDSLAFRIILFFPWCLPSAANLAVLVNMMKYFFEEYGYLVLLQNLSSLLLLTILYMIYFILVGL